MFDIGFGELILIAIIGLLVVGPEHLPGFVREIGKWAGRIRRFIHDTRFELERELHMDERLDLDKKIAQLDDMIESAPDRQPGFKPAPLPGSGGKPDQPAEPRQASDDR